MTRARDPEFDAALNKIDIETLLDLEGIDYRHSHGTRGLQLNLRECPACRNEGFKTYINADSGLGNCFHGSCGLKFNRFKLFRAISGLSGDKFDAYVKETAQQQGWLPKKKRPELVLSALKLPSKTYALPIQGHNLPYLAQRGVDGATAERFNLAYCNKGWWGYKLADGTERWVSHDKRVVIPVADLDGVMVSFQSRDTTGKQDPKYLFPVGYAVAGSHLYNGNSFEDGVTRHALVGEGAFDAIAIDCAIAGQADCVGMLAVATFGMHLSRGPDGQLAKFALLKARGLTTVTIMWDGEGKALAEAVKAGIELIGLGLVVRIARLPAGYDPAQGPDKRPTPAPLVRKAIFEAKKLDRLSAIRLLSSASSM